MRSVGSILATILPAAAAIAVFGTLYGAGARPSMGVPLTIASSLLIFSGSLQFAIVALLAVGAEGDAAERDARPAGPAAERMLLVSGVVCYLAWQTGTLIGILGAGHPGVAGVAGAIFPVLFIGLASLACRARSDAVRALGAAGLTAGLAFALPDLRALAPVVASVVVALPPGGDG